MGLELSRIVDTLHPLSANKRLDTLNNLLQDQKLYKRLVKGAKSANLSFNLQRTSVQPRPKALKILQPSSPFVDSTILTAWSNKLSDFWISPEFRLGLWDGELASFYDGTKQVGARHGLDAIRGRFQKLFYHDLLHVLNPEAAGDKATAKVYDQLVKLIVPQSQVTQDPEVVQSDLVSWVRAGRRYHKLAGTFGTAILFVLPDSLSIDFLEKRLPLEDKAFEVTTTPLVPWGLYAEKLDARRVAERIRKTTLESYSFLTAEISSQTNSAAPQITVWKPSSGTSTVDVYEPSIEVETGALYNNTNSIGALLNAAEDIAAVTQDQQDQQDQQLMEMAMMSEVVKLQSTLGSYLFKGINESKMRYREKDKGGMTFTDTVRLHFAVREGGDFKLEVWLCTSIGKAISQAKSKSFEDLRNILGDYLFEAMKASNGRKEEVATGMPDCSRTIDVSFPNGDGGDCKVEMMLCFMRGKEIYGNIYLC